MTIWQRSRAIIRYISFIMKVSQRNIENFRNHIQKKETVLKIWRIRSLTLEEKTISKTFANSKVLHLATVTVFSNSTITLLSKIHKEFIQNHKRSKIKEKILISNFDKDDLKDVNIPHKITSLKDSFVKRLFDTNFYGW